MLVGATLLLALCLFAASSALGATYYLDSAGGDDANDGTAETSAWRTLGRINATTFAPGDRILLKAGSSWTGHLWPKGSGAPGKPIVIGSYGEGPHPEHALEALRAEVLIEVQDDFAVGFSAQAVAAREQFFAQFAEVIDLSVGDEDERAILVFHGLMAAGNVNNAQAAMAQPGVFATEVAGAVGPAVDERRGHALQQAVLADSDVATDAAHG